jgi:hypothetical protein
MRGIWIAMFLSLWASAARIILEPDMLTRQMIHSVAGAFNPDRA